MEEINFDISQYDLNSAEERGVFFLESMETFGTLISGYFYIDPPNYIKAMDFISKYPKYNGKPYYEYLELKFEDFMFTFSSKKPKGSYKKYQLNKYMNTILSHAICLSQEVEDREKMNEILLNSILKNEEYWKFSDAPETFKQIYHK